MIRIDENYLLNLQLIIKLFQNFDKAFATVMAIVKLEIIFYIFRSIITTMTTTSRQNIFIGVSNSRREKFEAVHCSETELLCMLSLFFFCKRRKRKKKSCFKVFYMQKSSDLWMRKFTCWSLRVIRRVFKHFYHVFKIKVSKSTKV